MMEKTRNILSLIVVLFITSCVTVSNQPENYSQMLPGDELELVLFQGVIESEDISEGIDAAITYPVRDVKVSVIKAYQGEGISFSTLSDSRGFFSISPDYLPKGFDKTRLYYLTFAKPGYASQTVVINYPADKKKEIKVKIQKLY